MLPRARPPTDVDATAASSQVSAPATAPTAPLVVPLAGPLDIATSLEGIRHWGDDLLDRWDGVALLRTLPFGGRAIAYATTFGGTQDAPLASVIVEEDAPPGAFAAIADAVRQTFVLAPPEFAALRASDPVLARLDGLYPGLRTVRQWDLLAALVRCISAQQVNLRWAATTRQRLATAFGDPHTVAGYTVYSLAPQRLAAATVAEVRGLQFTTRKSEYLIAAAEVIASSTLDLPMLMALSDDEVIARLTAFRGIGRWTAEWILARTLGRPCVVAGDLGVRKAIARAYLGTSAAPLPPEDEVRRVTAHWGAAANIAQTLLLHGLSNATLGPAI